MNKLVITKELINLIKVTLPQFASSIENDFSLTNLIEITKNWRIGEGTSRINAGFDDKYSKYLVEIEEAYYSLGLNVSKLPSYKEYSAVIIFGTTGLTNCLIWKNLISYYEKQNIKFEKIFLLGGDRLYHPSYDNLSVAYKYFPTLFKSQKMPNCKNEIEIMENIASIVRLPSYFTNIPIISVYAQGKVNDEGAFIQADTEDTILKLKEEHDLSKDYPILCLNTLPYIARQGMQIQALMPNNIIDTAAYEEPYLETIETPLKGKLPTALYIDELYWLLYYANKYKTYLDN